MSRNVAKVVLDGAAGSYDKLYSYLIPENLLNEAKCGCRVTVPFGRTNIKKQGMIMEISDEMPDSKLKSILGVTDITPILSDEMLKMCVWMKERIFCTYYDAIHSMIPLGLSYRLSEFYFVNDEFVTDSLLTEREGEVFAYLKENGETPLKKLEDIFESSEEILSSLLKKEAVIKNSTPVRRMGDLKSRWVKLANDALPKNVKLTKRQSEIIEIVTQAGAVSIKELQYFTGVTVSVINALEKKGVFEIFEKEEFRINRNLKEIKNNKEIVLTDEQQVAFNGLLSEMLDEKPHVSLLYGVTGSGKTQVFLKLTDIISSMGKGVIIMVPEIALTPQIINLFSERYGDKIAVFHSAMSIGQRMDEYKRIMQGKALIAIGTRSAIFAPFEDLGLVIIDEEQEHTYKSEKSPRFHSRDLAKFRVNYHNALLCLASATPSLESYSLAKSGKYGLYTLNNRYGDAVLPNVSIIDMRKEILAGNTSNISTALAENIQEQLDAKKQIILLLNRRGKNTYVACPSCGWVASCPNCSISLTYHSANKRLMCHYCGYSESAVNVCPECKCEHIKYMGAGTQKLEEELALLFPSAKILRLDADSTTSRDSYSVNLNAFANGEYDIMIGTQMVAKGLDFPNVNLVGVIGADRALFSDDYRGFERVFSLLTQVIGRAGRSGGNGKAIVQTVDPENNVIELAKMQDYNAFYEQEIKMRRVMVYPPYCDICVVASQSQNSYLAKKTIDELYSSLKAELENGYKDVPAMILGPSASSVPKINNKYRYRFVIKCKNSKRLRDLIRKITSIKHKEDLQILVDINPETII